jgi:hypothetical protein
MNEITAGNKLKSTPLLLREGNVRRVIIRNASGRTLLTCHHRRRAGAVLMPF